MRATPAARRLAQEKRINLEEIAASIGERTNTESDIMTFLGLSIDKDSVAARARSRSQS
ncbi:MAG: E3 binding domain-containing protein [Kiritimatiellia bacterium]